MIRLFWAAILFLSLVSGAIGADWPQFRGPGGLGHSTSQGVPINWSETENIAWKTPIAGLGWSSPSIAGGQSLVTTAADLAHSLRAVCLDRKTGKTLHDVEVFHLDDPGLIHANNSHASPTPVIDGQYVFVHFGAHGTACVSTDGKVLWKTQDLKYNHNHGPGGSPLVIDDLLFITCDGTDVQFVVALDKRSGKIRWKRDRQHISSQRKSGELQVPMAYCTPLVVEVDGRTQLVALGSDAIVAHDPLSGDELWWFTYNGYSNVSLPVYDRGMLFFSTGFGEPKFQAIHAGGRGDVTETAKVWTNDRTSVVPLDVSPLVVDSELWTIADSGIAVCYDAPSGKQHWQKRLGSQFWASPVYAEGRIYCLDASGTTTVLAAGPKFEVLSTNKLDGQTQASPAIVDGAIFLRTDKHLYRIEKAPLAAAK
jgi:outer membrane protein assembly factor BamB